MLNFTTSLISERDFGMSYEPNLNDCPAHIHSYIEIAYTVSGEALHTLNGYKCTLGAGDYVIVNPGDIHSYEMLGSPQYSVINCIFNAKFVYPSAAANTFKECLKNPLLNINNHTLEASDQSYVFHNNDPFICNTFEMLRYEYDNKCYKYRTVCRNLLNIILLKSARSLIKTPQSTFVFLEYVKDYVSMHYAEDNLLQKMSAAIGYSAPYLCTKFHKESGITFTSFLQTIRIEAAITLLHETNMSVKDIAQAVGYKDIKHFYQIFKKIKNSTPSQHR